MLMHSQFVHVIRHSQLSAMLRKLVNAAEQFAERSETLLRAVFLYQGIREAKQYKTCLYHERIITK